MFVLSDHILLLWMEIWRVHYDADQTPFPFVGAAWLGMLGLLEILASLRVFLPHLGLGAAAAVTTNRLLPQSIDENGRKCVACLWL